MQIKYNFCIKCNHMSRVCCYGIEQPICLGSWILVFAVQTLESFAFNLFCLPFLKVMFSVQFLKLCPYIQECPHFGFWLGLFVFNLICNDVTMVHVKMECQGLLTWPSYRGEESSFLNKIQVLLLSSPVCSLTLLQ